MTETMTNRETTLQTMHPELATAFSLQEYKDRLTRVREIMAARNIDMLYLSEPENIFYISGYQAGWYNSNSNKLWPTFGGIAVHVDQDEFIFFETTDERILARNTSVATDIRTFDLAPNVLETVVAELKSEGWLGGTVALEMQSYRPNRTVSEQFQKLLEGENCTVIDGTDIVRRLRQVKSPQELLYMETAARITDIGAQAAIDCARPGVTELDVHSEIVYAMAKAGGELSGTPGLVNSGPARSCGHGLSSRRVIMPGDLVIFDICGVYNRYHVNIGRTISMGEPSPAVANYIALSENSVEVLKATLRPNLPVAELNNVMKDYYVEVGIWEDQWWLGGGFDFGINFPPDWVGSFVYGDGFDDDGRVFEPGMVVNMESMVYLPENAGVSWLINTIMYGPVEAKLLSDIPSDLIVIE